MKKVVVQLHIDHGCHKMKAITAVSTISGIDSICMDMKEKELTVVGTMDPVEVVKKLRRRWEAKLLTVEQAQEEQLKKPESNKEDLNNHVAELVRTQVDRYIPHLTSSYCYVPSAQENPNACVIC